MCILNRRLQQIGFVNLLVSCVCLGCNNQHQDFNLDKTPLEIREDILTYIPMKSDKALIFSVMERNSFSCYERPLKHTSHTLISCSHDISGFPCATLVTAAFRYENETINSLDVGKRTDICL